MAMSGRGRSSVVDQPAPRPPIPAASEKLATLAPEQIASEEPEPLDPPLEALGALERRSDLQAVAGPRNGDARTQADRQNEAPPADPQPAGRGGWTSNAEDAPS